MEILEVEMEGYCADCGTKLGGLSQQVGKKKDRRVVCIRCADILSGKRDKSGFLNEVRK